MNFIVVGVIAPLAYFLLRLLIKTVVQNFIINIKKNSKVAEVIECQKCGVFKPLSELKKIDSSYQCRKNCSYE